MQNKGATVVEVIARETTGVIPLGATVGERDRADEESQARAESAAKRSVPCRASGDGENGATTVRRGGYPPW